MLDLNAMAAGCRVGHALVNRVFANPATSKNVGVKYTCLINQGTY